MNDQKERQNGHDKSSPKKLYIWQKRIIRNTIRGTIIVKNDQKGNNRNQKVGLEKVVNLLYFLSKNNNFLILLESTDSEISKENIDKLMQYIRFLIISIIFYYFHINTIEK